MHAANALPEVDVSAAARHGGTGEANADTCIAYVMNGFPRLSETFIANEIVQLERLGTRLRLFVVKREDEPFEHPVVASIVAPCEYLPHATSLSGTTLWAWLRTNAGAFCAAHTRLAMRHPLRWLRTASSAVWLSWLHRPKEASDDSGFALRKVYIKEFLQAGHIADAVLRAGDVGHLHGHFCHGVATITWMASRLSGLPFSFTAHAKDIYQRELNPGQLLETKLGAARFVATCTCANAEVLRARHPRPQEVHAIYHGLDVDLFRRDGAGETSARLATGGATTNGASHRAAHHESERTDDAPRILAVGRFVEKKGFDHLVKACAKLRARNVRFACTIVGEEGSASSSLRAHIAALGLEQHVQLQGAMAQDALRALYRRAHLFALPCRVMEDGDRDGFPNVLAEAMAMGVPVVSTPISGIPEMIDDGVHGLLVEPRAADRADDFADALAGALERLLVDPALHERIARAGRERICERFDSRRTTRELRELFVEQLRVRQQRRALIA